MKKIPLSRGKFALIDDTDFKLLNKHRWCCSGKYAGRSTEIDGKKVTILMHRQILNTPKGTQVDHIDGNGINNQRENLRECTNGENSRNRKKHSNNKTGYKGVHFNKRSGKFQACVVSHGKAVYLGLFERAEIAAQFYNAMAKNLHGKFARLN